MFRFACNGGLGIMIESATTTTEMIAARSGWIKQIQSLGDKWILAKSIQRKDVK